MSGEGKLQNYSVDQVAGAFVLVMSAIGSLLLVVWQSKCHCKMNLCYIFQCERRPPSEEEMKGLKGQIDERKEQDKKDKQDKMEKGKVDRTSKELEPEPEPEALIPNDKF
tara:strand:+ start:1608 stop:1937 length:330 start_codon:yes stop_codon:yes gene_type:complete